MKLKIFRFLPFLLTVFVSMPTVAQVNQQSGWLASFNTIKLEKNWSLHLEMQLRSSDNWQQVQTILPRIGINYHLKSNQIVTAGYAFIPNRVVAFNDDALLGEHRVWQQFLVNQKAGNSAITHRFRLEERFVPVAEKTGNGLTVSERNYSSRLRYFIRALIPFKKQQPFVSGMFGALQEELFFNITDLNNVNGKLFDQNRAYGAVGYRFCKKFDMEIGYLNQFVLRRSNQANVSNHIIQLAFYTRL
ncbi:MAG: DUF2490 domain-containing protein [Bacteroidota bacterium]